MTSVPAVHQYGAVSSLSLCHDNQVNGIHNGTGVVVSPIRTPFEHLEVRHTPCFTSLDLEEEEEEEEEVEEEEEEE